MADEADDRGRNERGYRHNDSRPGGERPRRDDRRGDDRSRDRGRDPRGRGYGNGADGGRGQAGGQRRDDQRQDDQRGRAGSERGERRGYGSRDSRPDRRDDRGGYAPRPERDGQRFGDRRDDRDRGERPGGYQGRDDRDRGFQGRDDRGRGYRDDRDRSYRGRDDRDRGGQRGERPRGLQGRDDRGRGDRPRDDRPRQFRDRDERRGDDRGNRYQGRDERYPSREREEKAPLHPGLEAREDEPATPTDVDVSSLPFAVRAELRSLTAEHAQVVGAHLVAAGELIDEDPSLALAHAQAARRRAARLPVVREATAETAYAAGDYATALTEYRALRRMTGGADYLPVLADCERALGRPENALKLAKESRQENMSPEMVVEMTLVEAGARDDLDQRPEALRILKNAIAGRLGGKQGQARLRYAYADLLEQAGDERGATQWFTSAASFDATQELDAQERLSRLEGFVLEVGDDDDEQEEVMDEDQARPGRGEDAPEQYRSEVPDWQRDPESEDTVAVDLREVDPMTIRPAQPERAKPEDGIPAQAGEVDEDELDDEELFGE